MLEPVEARTLLDSIDVTTPIGLRDRALIGLMVYSWAALSMKVEDIYSERRRLWVRLREKGGKRHEMPCHYNLETYLTAYLDKDGDRRRSQGSPLPHHRARHSRADAYVGADRGLDRPGRAGIIGMHDLTRAVHATPDLRADERDVVITRLDWSVRGTPSERHRLASTRKEQNEIALTIRLDLAAATHLHHGLLLLAAIRTRSHSGNRNSDGSVDLLGRRGAESLQISHQLGEGMIRDRLKDLNHMLPRPI